VPTDEATAANPPDGAVLDYYLKEKAAGPIQLEIFDSDGKLVRRFASDDEPRKLNPNELSFPAYWMPVPLALSAAAGMHRFVWDLKYPLAKSVRASFFGPSGTWALLGNYIVKLTSNGKSTTQPLTVKLDPRVKTSQESLERQFGLATKIAARLGEVSAALQQLGGLRKEIEARKKEVGDKAEVVKALEELNQKLEALLETESETGFGVYGLALPGKKPEPLPKVASALTGLLMIVESADAAPTADATTASLAWDAAGEETLAQWSALQKEELASANAALQKAKLKPLNAGEPAREH
jgi:hypothetical protein